MTNWSQLRGRKKKFNMISTLFTQIFLEFDAFEKYATAISRSEISFSFAQDLKSCLFSHENLQRRSDTKEGCTSRVSVRPPATGPRPGDISNNISIDRNMLCAALSDNCVSMRDIDLVCWKHQSKFSNILQRDRKSVV